MYLAPTPQHILFPFPLNLTHSTGPPFTHHYHSPLSLTTFSSHYHLTHPTLSSPLTHSDSTRSLSLFSLTPLSRAIYSSLSLLTLSPLNFPTRSSPLTPLASTPFPLSLTPLASHSPTLSPISLTPFSPLSSPLTNTTGSLPLTPIASYFLPTPFSCSSYSFIFHLPLLFSLTHHTPFQSPQLLPTPSPSHSPHFLAPLTHNILSQFPPHLAHPGLLPLSLTPLSTHFHSLSLT